MRCCKMLTGTFDTCRKIVRQVSNNRATSVKSCWSCASGRKRRGGRAPGAPKTKAAKRLVLFAAFNSRTENRAYLPWFSSETVSFLRPRARREASTRRPFFVAILSRKPCLFTRRRLCGWNVLFILIFYFYVIIPCLLGCKSTDNFRNDKELSHFSALFWWFFIKM